MAKKPPGTRADKRAAKTGKRAMGKPVRQRPEQTRAKPGQVEGTKQDVSGNRVRDGKPVERMRLVCAADCKPCPDCGEPFCVVCQQHYSDCSCPGPTNAEDDGWEIIEENGVLYGIRPLRTRPGNLGARTSEDAMKRPNSD